MSKILLCINKTGRTGWKDEGGRGKEKEGGEDSSSQEGKVVKTKAELLPCFSPQERLQIRPP